MPWAFRSPCVSMNQPTSTAGETSVIFSSTAVCFSSSRSNPPFEFIMYTVVSISSSRTIRGCFMIVARTSPSSISICIADEVSAVLY